MAQPQDASLETLVFAALVAAQPGMGDSTPAVRADIQTMMFYLSGLPSSAQEGFGIISKQDAANAWAGTAGLSFQNAINVKCGTVGFLPQDALRQFLG